MKRAFHITIILGLLFVLYISVFHPILTEKMDSDDGFIGNLFNKEETKDFNMSAFSSVSSSGNVDRFNRICSFDEEGWVWCHQKSEYLYFSDGCAVTSLAMLITNAGRLLGVEKNYDPVDVFLANNYSASSTKKETGRKLVASWGTIAKNFNMTYTSKSISSLSSAQKQETIKAALKNNPWGVIIQGRYGSTGMHYIVARLDKSGNIIFDDPAFTSTNNIKNRAGAKINDISKVYSPIASWSNIKTLITYTPNLTNGKWEKKDSTWEKCAKDALSCHVCYVQMDCDFDGIATRIRDNGEIEKYPIDKSIEVYFYNN